MSNLACVQEPARLAPAGARAPRPHRLRLTISRLLAVGIAAAAGCQFDPSGQIGGDGGGDIPDARDAVPDDGNPGQPDANCSIWPFAPKHFDPCGPGQPVQAPDALVLDLEGVYSFNTDSGILAYPGGAPVSNPPVTTEERGVRTIWANGVTIEAVATLRVEGTKPLMIVSTTSIIVRGTIDVSSAWDPETKAVDKGAGSQPSDCSATLPEPGGNCEEGGGGGGGGGFSGGGGAGGEGASGRDCGSVTGAPGGAGGRIVSTPQSKIRGGCAGERGGNGNGQGMYGVGGEGGGAVHLMSATRILVEGAIHASGAGGAGAENNRSGGGGGGSGGFIGLEAPDIDIEREAVVAANGGGGGGGANTSPQSPGENGQLSDTAAAGGVGNGDGDGGDGSAGTGLNGLPGGTEDRGGGGGGGGAGFIVVYQSDANVAGGAIVSPPPRRQ